MLGCALALAAMLGSGPTAGAAEPQLLGAQSHATWSSVSTADMKRELDLLAAAGARVVRTEIAWSSLETDGKGVYSPWYVERIDSFVAEARARGIEVIATLWSTPCWASSAPEEAKQGCSGAWWDREVGRYAPRDPGDYADAAAWVARRWGDRLAALEIWNEPNIPAHRFLIAPDNARAYVALLRAAYPRVKEVAPGLKVLGGALAYSDERFLERLYELGAKGSFDGLSFHPYNEWRDPDDHWKPEWRMYTFITGVPAMHAVLRAHEDGNKALWLTELGFSSCGTGDRWCVNERQQAEYVADSLRIVRGWPFVAAAAIYNLRNKGSDPHDREHQFGLVHADFTPKPAFAAFTRALAGDAAESPAAERPAAQVQIVGHRLLPAPVGHRPLRPRPAPRLRLRMRCRGAGCVGRVRVSVRARRSGRLASRAMRRFAIPPGATRTLYVRLPRRSPRLLRRRGRVRVTAVARTAAAGVARRSFAVVRSR
jgi:polysaccharide biosynthesis protein PslG